MKKNSLAFRTLLVDLIAMAVIAIVVVGCGWVIEYNFLFTGESVHFMYIFKAYVKRNLLLFMALIAMGCGAFLWARHGVKPTKKLLAGCRPHLKPFLLIALLTVAALAVSYGSYLTGNRVFIFKDMGLDTATQFYPMYIWVIHSIREGTLSLWNFAWGVGCDTLTRQEWITDPFGIITVVSGLMFGDGVVRYILIWMQVLKVLLAIFFCYLYLGCFGFNWKIKSVVSWIYGFNGFLLLWGQHYYFGAASVYIVLLLYAVERYLKNTGRKNVFLVAIIMAAIMLYGSYFGYMFVLFGSIYAIFRIVWVTWCAGTSVNCAGTSVNCAGTSVNCAGRDDELRTTPMGGIRRFWHLLWPLMVSVIVGIVMAGVTVLPFVDLTVNVSSRMGNLTFLQKLKLAITESFDSTYYHALLSRIATNNMMGRSIYQEYYEYPELSFSMMNLVVLPQFLYMWFSDAMAFGKGAQGGFVTRRRLLVKILAAAILVLSLAFPFASFAFCGFGTISKRWTFVLMPLWAFCYAYAYRELTEKKKCSLVLLLISAAVLYYIDYWCFWTYKIEEKYVSSWILILNVLFIAGIAAYCKCFRSFLRLRRLFGMRREPDVGQGRLLGMRRESDAGQGVALAQNRGSWHRVWLMLALFSLVLSVMLEGYACNELRSVYTSNEMNDAGNEQTIRALEWIEGQDSSFYRVEKDYADLAYTSDSFIQDYYPLQMYCSSKSEELERYYDNIYDDVPGEMPNFLEMSQLMVGKMALVNVKYLLSRKGVNYDGLKLINEIDGIKIYENQLAGSIGTIMDKVIARSDFETLDGEERASVVMRYMVVDDAQVEKMKACGAVVYGAKEDAEAEAGALDVQTDGALQPLVSGGDYTLVSQTCIEGTINNTTGEGWLMLSIPWRKGWNVYIDGKKVESFKVDYAFMAVSVDEGEHTVTVKYENPVYVWGIVASPAGCVMLAAFMFLYGRKSGEPQKDLA